MAALSAAFCGSFQYSLGSIRCWQHNSGPKGVSGEGWERIRRGWPVQTRITKPKQLEDPPFIDPWIWRQKELIVETESEAREEHPPRPQPCCVACRGWGSVTCDRCRGRGRTNYSGEAILPKGVWPKWCWYCRGSGLACCARCLGTGEKRGIIGFHVDTTRDEVQEGNS